MADTQTNSEEQQIDELIKQLPEPMQAIQRQLMELMVKKEVKTRTAELEEKLECYNKTIDELNDTIASLQSQVQTIQTQTQTQTPKKPTISYPHRNSQIARPGTSLATPTSSVKSTRHSNITTPSSKLQQSSEKPASVTKNSPNQTAEPGRFSGIKRPTTSMGLTSRPTTASSGSSSAMKAPSLGSAMKAKTKFSSLRKPTEVQPNFAEQIKKDEEEDKFGEIAENFKKAPPQKLRHTIAPAGPKSTEFDEVDPIYTNKDPVACSLETRKKAGSVTYQVPDKNSKQGKFFFTLRLKGGPIAITEQQQFNFAKFEGKVDEQTGKMVVETKPKPDPIDKSLSLRLAQVGKSYTTIVKTEKPVEIPVFKLKVNGPMPELKEAQKDPTLGFLNPEAMQERNRRSTYLGGKKRKDEIEESLNFRISEGNSVYHIVSEKPVEVPVFKLRVNGPMPELKEAQKDPTLGFLNPEAQQERQRRSTYLGGKKRKDEIEESLNFRISEGKSVYHIVKNMDKLEDDVFTLKQVGDKPVLGE